MSVITRFTQTRDLVTRAAQDHGRVPQDVALVAVSKLFSADVIRPVLEAGHRRFGENYVQEARGKWPDLKADYPDVTLHMIGPLQSNKARDAVELFDVIETVDRESLARELSKEIHRQGRSPRLLIQVNTGDEQQKGGVAPSDVQAFIEACRERHGLSFDGLMCIPPVDKPPSPHFALLARLAAHHGFHTLSMGMSADFDAAIQQGATHVRIGSAIFGARG